ncbi:MAG: autotransporter domain-containing protein [Desulfomicrobium sp.]
MTVEANGGDTNSTAIGVFANDIESISVGGTISASAEASIPSALGIVANNSGTVLNTARITAYSNGADTYTAGIYTLNSGDLNNTGAISSTAMGTDSAEAHGIYVEESSGNIANSGNITASAHSESEMSRAIGIEAFKTGAISNSGNITASSEKIAIGIDAFNTGTISNSAAIIASARSESEMSAALGIEAHYTDAISNSGNITASARSESDMSRALGIKAFETGAISNSAAIIASARSESEMSTALGIEAHYTGAISNSGDITVSARSESETSTAQGIKTYETGAISNSGNITATSQNNTVGIAAYETGAISNSGDINATAKNTAFGIVAISANSPDAVNNSGDITATSENTAVGIYALNTETISNSAAIVASASEASTLLYDGVAATGIETNNVKDIRNTNSILAAAESNSSNAWAWARGIRADGVYESIINNDGLITAEATGYNAYAAGIEGSYVKNISNAGKITVNATALETTKDRKPEGGAYGIDSPAGPSSIENTESGVIAVHSNFHGVGIHAEDAESIINKGLITAEATGYQPYAGGITGRYVKNISNAGKITVNTTILEPTEDGTLEGGTYGIDATNVARIENTESGVIAVKSNFHGVGIRASALSTNNFANFFSSYPSVVNKGSIFMDAYSGAGIAIDSGNWNVYNPGLVHTGIGNDMRTLAVGMEGDSATARLMNDFRIIFDGVPYHMEGQPIPANAYVPQILVGRDGKLLLNDATLVALAGKNIAWNTPYRVIENRYEEEESGEMVLSNTNISGEFAALKTPNPNINVSWVDGDETGADAEAIFSYDPQASMPATGMRMANLGVMQFSNLIQLRTFSQLLTQHIKTQQDILLADSGAIASDAGFLVARSGDDLENAMFIRPYAKAINRSTSGGMGYDGNLYGFVLGYERSLSPELTLGAHAGLGFGAIDFKGDGYDENDEDQTVYSLGLHAAYNPDAWHYGGSATFYVAEHEYDGKTGNLLEIDEDDDYTSYGAELEAIAGYVIPSGNWAVMPYAGLGYSWITADSHSTDADNPDWDTTYGSVDEHIVRSILGAQLSGNLMWGEIKVIPTLGVRWEYALTDNNIKVEQSTLGSPSVTAEDDISRSSVIGEASIGFSKGTLNCELGGTAEYNDDYQTYGGWLSLRSAF